MDKAIIITPREDYTIPEFRPTKFRKLSINEKFKEFLITKERDKERTMYWFVSLFDNVDVTIEKPIYGEYYKYDIWNVIVRKVFTNKILDEFIIHGKEVNDFLESVFGCLKN